MLQLCCACGATLAEKGEGGWVFAEGDGWDLPCPVCRRKISRGKRAPVTLKWVSMLGDTLAWYDETDQYRTGRLRLYARLGGKLTLLTTATLDTACETINVFASELRLIRAMPPRTERDLPEHEREGAQ